MSETLPPLPCPFCGSDKIEYEDGDESSHYRCRNCGASSGRVYYTDAESSSDDYSASDAAALEAWNRRAALAQREPLREDSMRELVKDCGLDWHRGYAPIFAGDETNRYAVLIEEVQRLCGITKDTR
jgi:Lar family restriction alleviation protein